MHRRVSALNLPVYVSPIAVIFNVQGVKDLKLDADTLASIFAGRITKWNDAKIAATNSGVMLPDANITAVHRSDDSGTTNNFTDALHQTAPSVWTEPPRTPSPRSSAARQPRATPGWWMRWPTARTRSATPMRHRQDLGHAKLKVGDDWLSPTAEAAAKIVDQSSTIPGRSEHDLALKLNRKAAGVYPAVLVGYVLLCEAYKDAKDAELVKSFIGYVASAEGQKSAAAAAGSAPLTSATQAKVKAAIDSISEPSSARPASTGRASAVPRRSIPLRLSEEDDKCDAVHPTGDPDTGTAARHQDQAPDR